MACEIPIWYFAGWAALAIGLVIAEITFDTSMNPRLQRLAHPTLVLAVFVTLGGIFLLPSMVWCP